MTDPSTGAAPAGMRLEFDGTLRVEGRTLIGGSPSRLMRVAPAGAALLERWRGGEPVGSGLPERRLARRLLDAGMVHPCWEPVAAVDDVTVVVPTYGRSAELDRCLAAIRRSAPRAQILVVDDGTPGGLGPIPDRYGARTLVHPENRGPSAARNTGLAAVTTPFAALVDSDVVVPVGWLAALRPYFADPKVGAVAPRVVGHDDPTPGHGPAASPNAPARRRWADRLDGWLASYEAAHSPLDMGPVPAVIRPGSRVPYVPTATLLVRVAAFTPFDEDLPIGEDVDLEWRMTAAGWNVLHVPAVAVAHEHRTRLGAFVARRRLYARSIGLLERRHPGMLPAARFAPALAGAWLLLAARRPVSAGVAGAIGVGILATDLRPALPAPLPTAARLTATTALPTNGMQLARAVGRVWWPVLVPAAVAVPRLRTPLAAALAAPVLWDWWQAGCAPALGPYLAARLLDDVVSTAGTWEGSLRAGTLKPLLPSVLG